MCTFFIQFAFQPRRLYFKLRQFVWNLKQKYKAPVIALEKSGPLSCENEVQVCYYFVESTGAVTLTTLEAVTVTGW